MLRTTGEERAPEKGLQGNMIADATPGKHLNLDVKVVGLEKFDTYAICSDPYTQATRR